MRIDTSDETFREVVAAAHRIMDTYGQRLPDVSHEDYTDGGDLFIRRHERTIVIRHKGIEVMHTYMPYDNKSPSVFYSEEWITDVMRIANSIPEEAKGLGP